MSAKLLTVHEAAAFCDLGVQTLYNYKSRGKGPPVHFWFKGRRRRIGYLEKDLRAWLKARPARKKPRAA